ncbi:MAG: DMT family transporter, partial [Cypionkella sp.]|nr:DMT family transporter [Cypionkella sp.]
MRPLHGIAYKVASVIIFIVMAAMIKTTAQHVPPGQTVFFRSFFAIPVIMAWLVMRRELGLGLRTNNPLGHFWRGLMGTMAMGLGFSGLAYLPLPEVTALGYASPLLVVIFASMFLGENVRMFRIASVALGLTGVMIVLAPRLTVVSGDAASTREAFGAMVVLGGALFAALAQVTVRKLVMTERTPVIVFYFSLTATVLSLATLPFGWVMPTLTEGLTLTLAGLLGGVGQILLTSSYREADASLVA